MNNIKIIDRLDEETVAKLNDLKCINRKGRSKGKTARNKRKTHLNERDVLDV